MNKSTHQCECPLSPPAAAKACHAVEANNVNRLSQGKKKIQAPRAHCANIAGPRGTGEVNVEDLLALLASYGSSSPLSPKEKRADIDQHLDNNINVEDLLVLLGQYGTKCKKS